MRASYVIINFYFSTALVTEYRKAFKNGECIDVELISYREDFIGNIIHNVYYRINQALQDTKVVRQGFNHECGQVSQIKHRLSAPIEITEGKVIQVKVYTV